MEMLHERAAAMQLSTGLVQRILQRIPCGSIRANVAGVVIARQNSCNFSTRIPGEFPAIRAALIAPRIH
jgi:hypothetical protein